MIETSIGDIALQLETRPELFSPRSADPGTLAMLSLVQFQPADKVLDLGCGYGIVGIYAARLIGPERVFMTDADPLAVDVSRANAMRNAVAGVTVTQSDGFRDMREVGFTKILSNPPFHADFAVPRHFIEKGFNRLAIGGSMWMVTKRLDWYRNKLTAIFGGVRVHPIGDYFVFEAEKRSSQYAKARGSR